MQPPPANGAVAVQSNYASVASLMQPQAAAAAAAGAAAGPVNYAQLPNFDHNASQKVQGNQGEALDILVSAFDLLVPVIVFCAVVLFCCFC